MEFLDIIRDWYFENVVTRTGNMLETDDVLDYCARHPDITLQLSAFPEFRKGVYDYTHADTLRPRLQLVRAGQRDRSFSPADDFFKDGRTLDDYVQRTAEKAKSMGVKIFVRKDRINGAVKKYNKRLSYA